MSAARCANDIYQQAFLGGRIVLWDVSDLQVPLTKYRTGPSPWWLERWIGRGRPAGAAGLTVRLVLARDVTCGRHGPCAIGCSEEVRHLGVASVERADPDKRHLLVRSEPWSVPVELAGYTVLRIDLARFGTTWAWRVLPSQLVLARPGLPLTVMVALPESWWQQFWAL